jgi:hypothetical protein
MVQGLAQGNIFPDDNFFGISKIAPIAYFIDSTIATKAILILWVHFTPIDTG